MDTILWFLCYIPNKEIMNYDCVPSNVLTKFSTKTLSESITLASLIKVHHLKKSLRTEDLNFKKCSLISLNFMKKLVRNLIN